MEIISVGHTNFLVKVELMRIQDLRSLPKSSWRLLPNALNSSYMTKVAQTKTITHTNLKKKQLLWPMLFLYYEN